MMFFLRALGPFHLLSPAGVSIPISSRKHQALIAILALSSGIPVPRSKLAGTLWAEQREADARNSLRQALFAIRKATAEHAETPFVVDNFACRIRPGSLQSDVGILLGNPRGERPDTLVGHPEGDFLEGLHFEEEALDAWLLLERRRFCEVVAEHLFRTADHHERCGDRERALDAAQRVLRHDPYHEPSHRIVLRSYLSRGERNRALQHFEHLCRLLMTDLDVLPETETHDLMKGILGRGGDNGVRAEINHKPRLGVLPIQGPSRTPDERAAAHALARKLAGELARFSPISVVAATSMFAMESQQLTAEEIGTRLEADYLVEVGVQGSASGGWTIAQLTAVGSGTQIWSRTYPDKMGHSPQDEETTVRLISGNLYQFLMKHAASISRTKSRGSATAGELYLQAFRHVEHPTEQGLRQAKILCDQLLSAEPAHILVRETAAWINFHSCFNGWLTDDPLKGFQEARELLVAGLALDNQEPYLLSAFGLAEIFLGEIGGGLAALEQAVSLNPSDAEFHTWLGAGLTAAGRTSEAHRAFDEADRLSPDYPPVFLFRGEAYLTSGDSERCVSCLDRFLAVLPEYHWARLLRAAAHQALGSTGKSAAGVQHVKERAPRLNLSYIRRLLAGRDSSFRQELVDRLEEAGLPEATEQPHGGRRGPAAGAPSATSGHVR